VFSNDYKIFLDGTQLITIGSVVLPYLHEVRPIILQSSVLDEAPTKLGHGNPYTQNTKEMNSLDTNIFGWIIVQLGIQDFSFLWGLAISILCEQYHEKSLPSSNSYIYIINGKIAQDIHINVDSRLLSKQYFYDKEMFSFKFCLELLQMLIWAVTLALSILEYVLKFYLDDRINNDIFLFIAPELCMYYNIFGNDNSNIPNHGDLITTF